MADEEAPDPAYLEGRRAAERSVKADANPHPQDSDAHRLWQEGHASVTAADVVADAVGDFA